MPDDSGPRSIAEKFWRTCLLLFGGVILLALTIELIKSIWWILALIALTVVIIGGLLWWWRRRNTWL